MIDICLPDEAPLYEHAASYQTPAHYPATMFASSIEEGERLLMQENRTFVFVPTGLSSDDYRWLQQLQVMNGVFSAENAVQVELKAGVGCPSFVRDILETIDGVGHANEQRSENTLNHDHDTVVQRACGSTKTSYLWNVTIAQHNITITSPKEPSKCSNFSTQFFLNPEQAYTKIVSSVAGPELALRHLKASLHHIGQHLASHCQSPGDLFEAINIITGKEDPGVFFFHRDSLIEDGQENVTHPKVAINVLVPLLGAATEFCDVLESEPQSKKIARDSKGIIIFADKFAKTPFALDHDLAIHPSVSNGIFSYIQNAQYYIENGRVVPDVLRETLKAQLQNLREDIVNASSGSFSDPFKMDASFLHLSKMHNYNQLCQSLGGRVYTTPPGYLSMHKRCDYPCGALHRSPNTTEPRISLGVQWQREQQGAGQLFASDRAGD